MDTGSGDPPVLFIHGWCCDRSYWRDQLLEFQAAQDGRRELRDRELRQ
jgi:pimeloyl-ACP methyl ester carboxylesterase